MPTAYLTTKEVAARLGVSTKSLRTAVTAGRLRAWNFGDPDSKKPRLRFTEDDVKAYIARSRWLPRPYTLRQS